MPKGHEKDSSKTTSNTSPETVRDARDISNVLLILDSQSIRTSPFGANVSGENSYKRAERLSAALHLITNHVPEEEPLRTMTRTKALELLSVILDLRVGFRAPASEKGQEALSVIRELISFVRLLAVAGFISRQNAEALAEALDELGNLIVVSQRSTLAEQVSITRDHLIPPASATSSTFPRTSHSGTQHSSDFVKRTSQKDTAESEGKSLGISSGRSERILEILKLGGVLGIKDISSNLPQYSEKMVQRELSGLVDSGRVRKMGEKRWSKYQFVR